VKAHEELEQMTLNPATYSTRSLSLLMIALFAGTALWLFAPSGFGVSGSGSGNGGDASNASAALPSSVKVDGTVQVESHDNIVTRIVVPLSLRGSDSIAISNDAKLRAETAMSDTAAAAVPATFSIKWLDGNGDSMLDAGEHAVLTVDLPAVSTIHPGNPLDLVLKSAEGATLTIENVLGN
jgi:hypothetical protein